MLRPDGGIFGVEFNPHLVKRPSYSDGALVKGIWRVVCRDPSGIVKWDTGVYFNIVVNVGLDYLLDAGLSGGTPITSWFVGLTDGTPTVAAADTMASHAGWVEVTAYSEGTRQAWTDGGVSGQSVDNVGNEATFTINADTTVIGGAFLVSNSTKGGTTGTLYAAGAFTVGDKSADTNDTLEVTATFTAADDGV